MYYKYEYASPIGRLTLASDGSSLVGLWIEGQKHFQYKIVGDLAECCDNSIFSNAVSWLVRYFAGMKPAIRELSLSPIGSEFQREVWDILCGIPYGEVVTYGSIAEKIALARKLPFMSSQAVGGGVGRNPISIIIPCHRVIGTDGKLTGYAGGIDKKEWLLKHEGYLNK